MKFHLPVKTFKVGNSNVLEGGWRVEGTRRFAQFSRLEGLGLDLLRTHGWDTLTWNGCGRLWVVVKHFKHNLYATDERGSKRFNLKL